MKRYPLYILDLDGTLFRGEEPTPGAVETVAKLRREGSLIRYLTNNSTQTRASYVAKLARLGFEAELGDITSSATGTAAYLCGAHPVTDHGLEGRATLRVFVVGEPGLAETLADAGITVTDAGPEAVVTGLCRSFGYDLMNRAMQFLLDPTVRFVATNRDATYPMEGGRIVPGAGAIIASLVTCSGREPEVIGKPNPYLVELILREAGVDSSDALVVGDRIDTDMVAGQRAGCPVHLVLTGVTLEAPVGMSWSEDLRGLV